MMNKIIFILVLISPLAVCNEEIPSDQEIEETVTQTIEISRRVTGYGMRYQVLKRCGASADMLKNIKAYLYKDIEKARSQNPKANVNIDGLFEMGFEAGNESYEMAKSSPDFCANLLEQTKKYFDQ
jgi:hypothetical protein